MKFIVEQDIEDAGLEILQELGYKVVYGPDIAPDGDNPERAKWDDVVLVERLRNAINKLNPDIPEEGKEEAIKKVLRSTSHKLLQNNKAFHKYLTNGVEVEYRYKGRIKGDIVQLFNFEKPKDNEFLAINQFTIIENKKNRRPDILLFINGLPLVTIELKSPTNPKATIDTAFKQLQTYHEEIPTLFNYNTFEIVSDGKDARAGTITSPYEWFLSWRTINGTFSKTNSMETTLRGMCDRESILDIAKNFLTFTNDNQKILAGYHQYNATKKAIQKTYKAIGATKKIGVVWHTQGSGKSFTMGFYTALMNKDPKLKNPTIVILTDRNDLDDQLYDTFASLSLFQEPPKKIKSQEELKVALKVSSGGIIFTTIHKFLAKNGSTFEQLSTRDNIIVVTDEAHRTQYGFKAKLQENILKYGLAKYLRDALPNASFIGFTGTPIEFDDKSTRGVFGEYIDIYDMHLALEDHRVVKIIYDSKLIKLGKNEEIFKQIDDLIYEFTEQEEKSIVAEEKAKWSTIEALAGSKPRIEQLAKSIINHFEMRQLIGNGKAMVVCMSRRICIELHDEIKKLRPDWYNKDDDKGLMKIVMTGSASDGKEYAEHTRNKENRKELAKIFKDPKSDFKLVIVRDMWLTGFDVPCLNTLYIDKIIKHHNLMQTIARVNRVYKDKEAGLVIDFIGIADELRKAVTVYTQTAGKNDPLSYGDQAIAILKEKYEIVKDMLSKCNYEEYYKTTNSKKRIDIFFKIEEHILGLDDGKKRFVRNVQALMKALDLSITSDEAKAIREDAALFQSISRSLMKTETEEGTSRSLSDSVIKQLVSKAVEAEGEIDVFKHLNIQRPEISILSDKFLETFQNMEYKNLAFETLKKLLADEIRTRFKTNKIENKKFSKMLEDAILKYQSRSIDSAQIIAELIDLAKNIRTAQSRGEKLGLTDDEIAFYDALADNESAKEILGEEVLKKIAREMTDIVKQNTSIDWKLRETVRAKLRVIVKRLLKKYGYP
ncbi:MAG: type I restriction endonuclease subunit R, partial [Candidatus Woesearchaeota archaeon]